MNPLHLVALEVGLGGHRDGEQSVTIRDENVIRIGVIVGVELYDLLMQVAAGMLALDHDDIPEPRAVFLNAGEAILVVFCVVGTRLDENVASHGRDRVGM